MTAWRVTWLFISWDIFVTAGELYVALVTSTKANARLINVDSTPALAMPGVVGFLDHTSVPGHNMNAFAKDEEIFATSQVRTVRCFSDKRAVFSEFCIFYRFV